MPSDLRGLLATTAVDTTLDHCYASASTAWVSAEPLVQKQGLDGRSDPAPASRRRGSGAGQGASSLQNRRLLEWKAVTYPPDVAEIRVELDRPGFDRRRVLAQFGGRASPTTPSSTRRASARATRRRDRVTTRYWPLQARVSTVIGSRPAQRLALDGRVGRPGGLLRADPGGGRSASNRRPARTSAADGDRARHLRQQGASSRPRRSQGRSATRASSAAGFSVTRMRRTSPSSLRSGAIPTDGVASSRSAPSARRWARDSIRPA